MPCIKIDNVSDFLNVIVNVYFSSAYFPAFRGITKYFPKFFYRSPGLAFILFQEFFSWFPHSSLPSSMLFLVFPFNLNHVSSVPV